MNGFYWNTTSDRVIEERVIGTTDSNITERERERNKESFFVKKISWESILDLFHLYSIVLFKC